MLYTFLKLLSKLVPALPPALRRGIGDALGAVLWPFVPRRRRDMMETNISRSLTVDRTQARRIGRRSAVRFGRMFMELLCLPGLQKQTIPTFIASIEGLEHLRQAQALGRGAILVTAHSDNWELAGSVLALQGFPLVAVPQKQHNAAMDCFISEYRCAAGMKIIYKTDVRNIMRALLAGGILGLFIDQDAHEEGVFVDFFGRQASTPKGAAAMARLNDVPLIPIFSHQDANGRHVITLQPPLRIEKTADREQDIRQMTQRLTRIVEEQIRRYPEEWFWLHNRWKTPPPKVL